MRGLLVVRANGLASQGLLRLIISLDVDAEVVWPSMPLLIAARTPHFQNCSVPP